MGNRWFHLLTCSNYRQSKKLISCDQTFSNQNRILNNFKIATIRLKKGSEAEGLFWTTKVFLTAKIIFDIYSWTVIFFY